MINVKVDGLQHRRVKKKRFDRLRDAFLQSNGIVGRRIETSTVSSMNESQLEQCMQDLVASVLEHHKPTSAMTDTK